MLSLNQLDAAANSRFITAELLDLPDRFFKPGHLQLAFNLCPRHLSSALCLRGDFIEFVIPTAFCPIIQRFMASHMSFGDRFSAIRSKRATDSAQTSP